MKALRSFTVRPRLPEPLVALDRLSRNLRWSWDRPTRDLFATIDPRVWDDSAHDPRRVLAEASPARLEQLASDPAFLEHVRAADDALTTYLEGARWYQQHVATAEGRGRVRASSPTSPRSSGSARRFPSTRAGSACSRVTT